MASTPDRTRLDDAMRQTSLADGIEGDGASTAPDLARRVAIDPSGVTDCPDYQLTPMSPDRNSPIPQQQFPRPELLRIASTESFSSQQSSLTDVSSLINLGMPRVNYLGVCSNLPIDAPPNHPHIIDISSIDYSLPQRGLGFADVAVTVLYSYDLAVLISFLDLSKKRFDFRRKPSTSDGAIAYIERRVKFVTIGFLKPDGKTVQDAISYRIGESSTGPWEPLAVLGSLSQSVVGPELIEDYVRGAFARNMMMQRMWEKGEGVKFDVKVR